jgi:hypothetical protein
MHSGITGFWGSVELVLSFLRTIVETNKSYFISYLQSFESTKLQFLSEKFSKIEEAAKIREEAQLNFAKQTEQKLQTKMETNKENREAHLNNLLERLRKTVSVHFYWFHWVSFGKGVYILE